MVKLLITGFKHSGTTMLMQLLRSHPQVGWIEMEEGYIEYDKPKDWVLMMAKKRAPNMKEKLWGDKLPWGERDDDIDAKRPIRFSNKWLNMFGKQARILHILRHPIDVASSGRNDGEPGEIVLKEILNSVPKYIDFINNHIKIATIVYENLVMNPHKHLSNIFNFLEIISSEKVIDNVANTKLKFDKINSDRAYAFQKKNKKMNIDIDYNEITERINIRL